MTSPSEDKTKSNVPAPPPRPQPQAASNRGCGWTLLSITSFVVIRSCFTALETPGHQTYSSPTYQLPSPTAAVQRTITTNNPEVDSTTNTAAAISTSGTSTLTPTPSEVPPTPTIVSIPEGQFVNVNISFSTPGPEARGSLRNETSWTLTGATVVIARKYRQIVTGVVLVDPPAPDSSRFEIKIPGGTIAPFTTTEITANIGHYLDSYEDDLGNGLRVKFRVSDSSVTIVSMSGYRE